METMTLCAVITLVTMVAVVLIAMPIEHPELVVGRKFFSNCAPKQKVIIDIFTGSDGKPYVQWQYVNNKNVICTTEAKNFLLTNHVCW